MSNVYQPKRKELAKVKVVSSQCYGNNRSKYKFVGSVQRVCTNFVTTQRNIKTGKCSFIDDTSSLTKKTKGELVKFFMNKENKRKDVAYLVVPKETTSKKVLVKNKVHTSKEKPLKKRKIFTDDFEYDSRGRIKGSYNINGFFEPD